jgi:hypothetical protein
MNSQFQSSSKTNFPIPFSDKIKSKSLLWYILDKISRLSISQDDKMNKFTLLSVQKQVSSFKMIVSRSSNFQEIPDTMKTKEDSF